MDDLNRDDWKLKATYQSYIQEELLDESTKQAKKALLNTYFKPKRLALAPFPTFALCAFAVAIFLIWYIPSRESSQQTLVNATRKELPITAQTGDVLTKTASPITIGTSGSVSVMNVESKVGPTMVYQKMYQDVLVTVIWVFPGAVQ